LHCHSSKDFVVAVDAVAGFRETCTSFCFSLFEESNESCSSSTQHPNSSPSYSIHKRFLTQFLVEIFGKCIVNTLILLLPISIHKNFFTQFLVEIVLANGFFLIQNTTDPKLETPNSGGEKILENTSAAAVAARKNPHERRRRRRRRRSKHVAASSTAIEFCTKY
jgi:hypothetical protein